MYALIKWYKGDPTPDQYVEVSTDNPLPVTTVGSGSGGSEQVQITSSGGDATTGTYANQAITIVGLDTNARIMGVNGTNAIPVAASNMTSDNSDAATIGIFTNSRLMGFDGTTWDRLRVDSNGRLLANIDGNTDGTALPSSARTATTNSADLSNAHGTGVNVVLDVSASSGSPSITLKIQGKDVVSGKYYDILSSGAVTAVSTTVLKVYPGLTAAANSVANDIIPATWRVSVEHSNTDSIQYSVGYSIV